MKVMSPQDVNDLADRVKELNDYIQKTLEDSQYWAENQILKKKEKLRKYMSNEMAKVSKAVEKQVDPVVNSITKLKKKYEKLLPTKVSGDLGHVIGYLEDVATELFSGPYNEILELLASYAIPVARLNAEMQKLSTVSLKSVSLPKGNVIKVKPPKIVKPEIPEVDENA